MSSLSRSFLAVFFLSLPSLAGPPAQGIKNFHQVDGHVYRGAQPTTEGFSYLAGIGIKTIVDLRENGSRSSREAKLVTSLGMRYVNVPMSGLAPPTKPQITRILALLEDSKSGAVFVHCRFGEDRTGSVIAAYRIDHDHWDNAQALKEARDCGMGFYEIPRQNYIRHFQPLTAKDRAAAPDNLSWLFLALSALASVAP
jgi:protein tyrosine phosphatase (PTP) superfamily phosphohydrolase (DUF442 family)